MECRSACNRNRRSRAAKKSCCNRHRNRNAQRICNRGQNHDNCILGSKTEIYQKQHKQKHQHTRCTFERKLIDMCNRKGTSQNHNQICRKEGAQKRCHQNNCNIVNLRHISKLSIDDGKENKRQQEFKYRRYIYFEFAIEPANKLSHLENGFHASSSCYLVRSSFFFFFIEVRKLLQHSQILFLIFPCFMVIEKADHIRKCCEYQDCQNIA